MAGFEVRLLDETTWADFKRLVEKHNGVFGGCWCMGFHAEGVGRHKTSLQNRAEKEARVKAGNSHAALVFDGAVAVGWCQFGRTAELPRIKHRRQYDAERESLPDWRITCFFVDKSCRRRGVASAALAGALEEIANQGGGIVESYPEDVTGRKAASAFLYNATLSMFEKHGFVRMRRLGMHHWVVTKRVQPKRD